MSLADDVLADLLQRGERARLRGSDRAIQTAFTGANSPYWQQGYEQRQHAHLRFAAAERSGAVQLRWAKQGGDDRPLEQVRLLDVGSGGGMPGIPLAILFPESHVTCLDSNGKKTRFLTQVKLELKLDNLQVIHSRVEEFQPAQPFTGIVSRAFSSMENFSNWTRHLGDSETRWLAMKGVHPADELVALPSDFRLDGEHALTVPGCQGQRHLLILRRTA